MSSEREDYEQQAPSAHDLYRARERALEVDQAGRSRAEVTQAQANAKQTEAAYMQADAQRWEKDPAYRAEVEQAAEMAAGA